MIRNSATVIRCMMSDFIDFVKCKEDGFKPQPETFKVESAILAIIELYRLRSEARRINFELKIEPDVPVTIEADK